VEDSSEFNFLRGSAFGKLITKIAIVKIRKRKEFLMTLRVLNFLRVLEKIPQLKYFQKMAKNFT
jgi:hypothetical protein